MAATTSVQAYLAGFNTNPACAGVGPTDVPTEPGKAIALAVYIFAAAFIIITSMWYFRMRQFRRRLKIRSMNPIFMGSLGSAIIILVRAGYNFAGRENLSCAANLTLVYMFFVLNLVPDNLAVASFSVKQKFREQFSYHQQQQQQQQPPPQAQNSTSMSPPGKNSKLDALNSANETRSDRVASSASNTPKAASVRRIQDTKSASGKEGSSTLFGHNLASPVEWFKGFWNHFTNLSDGARFDLDEKIKFNTKMKFNEGDRYVSPVRELTYEICSSGLFAGSLFFGLGLRLGLVESFKPANGCSGCTLQWEELPILLACTVWLGILQLMILYRTRNTLDPLNYRFDLIILSLLTLVAWIGYFLAAFDPGNLMKEQKVDWFLFESLSMLLMHIYRCVVQLYRVARFHRLGEQQIRLIDLLQDHKAAILFEKYLMGELASENLLFWREALKYKIMFDKNKDLDYSQQVAKVLFRTFVSRQAQLPINISGKLRDAIEGRFRSGFVGKNVFDEALIELYNMMQNGPFYRFVRSKEFLDYARTNADFSLIVVGTGNSRILSSSHNAASGMQIIPATESMRDDLENGMLPSQKSAMVAASTDGKFDVAQYIHAL